MSDRAYREKKTKRIRSQSVPTTNSNKQSIKSTKVRTSFTIYYPMKLQKTKKDLEYRGVQYLTVVCHLDVVVGLMLRGPEGFVIWR